MSRPPLVLCAKSRWDPPIRREHAFAREAALHGHTVDFVEQPADIRALARIAEIHARKLTDLEDGWSSILSGVAVIGDFCQPVSQSSPET